MYSDPYSRIGHEYEDGTVWVCFRISKDIFDLLVDIASFMGGDIDKCVEKAIQMLGEKNFGKRTIIKLAQMKRPKKVFQESKTLKELKEMVSFLSKLIMDINSNLERVQRISDVISSSPPPIVHEQKPRHSSSNTLDIDLGELKEVSDQQTKKMPEKSLEDAIEDVLVVAIAEDILNEK